MSEEADSDNEVALSPCRLCNEEAAFDLSKNKFMFNDDDILLLDAFNEFSTLKNEDEDVNLCTSCTESLIVSYTFLQKVKESDEKYANIKSEDEEEPEYELINVVQDNERATTGNDEETELIMTAPTRKRTQSFNKPSLRCEIPAKLPSLHNMALPQFTVSTNTESDDEESNAIAVLDELIEEISPKQKRFKCVNVSAMKLTNHTATANGTVELNNLDTIMQTSAVDDGKTIFKCDHCPKAFATAYHLMVHKRKSHVCQHCLESFDKPNDLYAHIKQKHVNFDCLLCGRVFRSNSNLRQHMRNTHSIYLPAHVSLINLEGRDAAQ